MKLIPPIYVKPFVKRQKNDATDAEAIAEAASRPTMRFVAVKSADQQAAGMALKTRSLFVRQKTQAINALRGHLAEHGVVASVGTVHLKRLQSAMTDEGHALPEAVVMYATMILDQIAGPESLWRDIKTYQHHAYVVSEGGSGIQVVDLSQIDSGVVTLVTTVTGQGTDASG